MSKQISVVCPKTDIGHRLKPDLFLQTPNAEFDYLIDPEYPYAANYFDITKDGVVYVRSNLQTADGRETFEVSKLSTFTFNL